MILEKAIRYIILDYCLDVFFDGLHKRLITDSKYMPLTELPKCGDKFAILYNSITGYTFYKVTVTARSSIDGYMDMATDPDANDETSYAELDYEAVQNGNGKIIEPTVYGLFSLDIYGNSLHEWFYVK
jgi:hypothetical protein